MSRRHPSTLRLRRSGFFLVREGPRVEIWAKFRREGSVVLFSAILRGTRDRSGNVPSTAWRLSVAKHVNARQRRELMALARAGL